MGNSWIFCELGMKNIRNLYIYLNWNKDSILYSFQVKGIIYYKYIFAELGKSLEYYKYA